VNDPYFNTTVYPYANITDIILYTVNNNTQSRELTQTTSKFATPVIPFQYPLFKQCNNSWGSDVMEQKTICQVGCLMSSTSMAINGKKIRINGVVSDPQTLNKWLRANHGYAGGDNLEEAVVPKINSTRIQWPADGMHKTNDLPMTTIRSYLDKGRITIANVMKGGHFVLAVGYDRDNEDLVYVHDPGFDKTSYSYKNDIVGWRLFDMK